MSKLHKAKILLLWPLVVSVKCQILVLQNVSSLSLIPWTNRLERLFLKAFFSLTFMRKARAHLCVSNTFQLVHSSCRLIIFLTNFGPDQINRHSSLLVESISDEERGFKKLATDKPLEARSSVW
jgi:hypothetical protein